MAKKADKYGWLKDVARLGGLARSKALTPAERSAIASKASKAAYKGMTKAERSKVARRAVLARWKRRKAQRFLTVVPS